jgi:2,3-bisphosphoglycerate-independent phosphoglycerate mutase
MTVLDAGNTIQDQMQMLKKVWNDYDFFFIHFKYTDSTGEDGNFAAKVEMTEKLDAAIPDIRKLNPTVLVVTGDHSTPSKMRSHSWHGVPVLLAAKNARFDNFSKFGESNCRMGGLGQLQAKHLMTLAMAHAGRLGKFGA